MAIASPPITWDLKPNWRNTMLCVKYKHVTELIIKKNVST